MSVLEYKCPNCGGAVSFDTDSQKMNCPYCDAEFDPEAIRLYNESLKEESRESYDWNEYNTADQWSDEELSSISAYICPSCAGEIIGDANTAATHCPYCGSPAIMPKQLEGMFKPDFVIPFKLDKSAAIKAFKSSMKGKVFLPTSFKTTRLDEIQGIYVPFWLFDCDTDSQVRYKGEKVRTWTSGSYQYTETSHFQLERAGTVDFVKLPVDGSKKMDDTYMEAIEPYDYKGLVNFQMAYLSGYLADKYDVDVEQSRPRANERIKKSVEQLFRNTTSGYTNIRVDNTNIKMKDGKINYALMPVWMLNTKYKNKIYSFAMNGQTGKLIGSYPVDKGKWWGWFFGILALLNAIGLLIHFATGESLFTIVSAFFGAI